MTDSAHIVRIYDVGVVGDEVFLAMELIRGQTLTAWLGAERRGWREIVRIFVDAARGLAAAHEVGLVHRDFKPDNVLISEDGRVRVADFGLAREEHGGDAAWNPGTRGLLVDTLTATGVLMGTPMYMSPEQHRGEAAGPASDIFSFAVALHEGLYGLRPFAGDTMAELARNVEAGALVATPTDRGVPGWVDAVVRRCLSPKTEDRFASFDALIAALDRDPTGARRRWLFGVGVTAALVGLSGLALAQRSIEPCEGGEELIAAAWGDGGEEALEARLAALPEAARASIEPRVLTGLRSYGEAWVGVRRGACMSHQAGETSARLLDAQMRCLESRREALQETITVLGDRTPSAFGDAAMVVARLPRLAHCEDVDALLAEVSPPEEPAVADEVASLRTGLVRARVLANADRHDEALAIAGEAEARGASIGYRPLAAEAALLVGRVLLEGNRDPVQAEAALSRAVVAATAAKSDAIAAEAEARRLYVRGLFFGRDAQVLDEAARAEAMVDRLGDRDDLRALLVNNLGGVLLHRGDEAQARERFARAIELADGDPRVDPIDLASGYLNNAAQVAATPEARDRLFTRARGILEASLGPTHPLTVTLDFNWASRIAEPAIARDRMAPACAALMDHRADLYPRCAECYLALGHLEDALGQAPAAASAMEAAQRCFTGPITADDEGLRDAQVTLARGYELLYTGESAAALDAFVASEAIWRPQAEAWWIAPSLADVLIGRGRALIALGRGEEARPALEEAIAALTAHLPRDPRASPRMLLEDGRAALVSAPADP